MDDAAVHRHLQGVAHAGFLDVLEERVELEDVVLVLGPLREEELLLLFLLLFAARLVHLLDGAVREIVRFLAV